MGNVPLQLQRKHIEKNSFRGCDSMVLRHKDHSGSGTGHVCDAYISSGITHDQMHLAL